MGKLYDQLDDNLKAFINAQQMFFVATAPRADDGHINVSPKGLQGSFAILGNREVAYLDLPGSGVETIAHVKENRRITLMFCAFQGAPNIVRLYGKGEVVEPEDDEFAALAKHFPHVKRARSIIRVQVSRITDSCGYGVPLMEYVRDRETLTRWIDSKGSDVVKSYIRENNAKSIDGLSGVAD